MRQDEKVGGPVVASSVSETLKRLRGPNSICDYTQMCVAISIKQIIHPALSIVNWRFDDMTGCHYVLYRMRTDVRHEKQHQ